MSQPDPTTVSSGDLMSPAVREAHRPQSSLMELTFQRERKVVPHIDHYNCDRSREGGSQGPGLGQGPQVVREARRAPWRR